MLKKLMLTLTLLWMIPQAFADCELNGRYYPTGARVQGKICQDDGTWR